MAGQLLERPDERDRWNRPPYDVVIKAVDVLQIGLEGVVIMLVKPVSGTQMPQ